MRKSLLVSLLVIALLAFSLAGADAPVFVLVDAPSPDAAVLGTAVLTDPDGLELVTSPVCVSAGTPCYAVIDGTYVAVEDVTAFEAEHIAVLKLAEPCTATATDLTVAAPVSYVGVKQDGTIVTGRAAEAAQAAIGMTVCMERGVLPGAVLLAADGSVSGIVTYAVNEGYYRYSVSCTENFIDVLDGASLKKEPTLAELAGLTVTPDDTEPGLLQARWTQPGMTAYSMVEGNDYLTEMNDSGAAYLLAVPGRDIIVWLLPENPEFYDMSDIAKYPNVVYTCADEPLTMHSFADVSAYVTVADHAAAFDATEQVPVYETITVDDLTGGKAVYLQVTSTYEIDHEEEYIMTAVLTTPDGRCFTDYSGFIFAPEYMPEDVWHWDVTELFKEANRMTVGGFQPGRYSLAYYIGGQKASEVLFAVEAAAEAAPAVTPAPAGMEQGSHFTMSNGTVTIDWSDLEKADKWRLFFEVEGNSFITWFDVEDTSATLCLAPGRMYAFAAAPFTNEVGPTLQGATVLGVCVYDDVGTYTDHGFTEVTTYAAVADPAAAGSAGEGPLLWTPEIKASDLAAGKHLYMQAAARYDVAEEYNENALLVLELPDGQCFTYSSGYIFSPEYAANDCWYIDVTELFHLDQPDFAALLDQPGTFKLNYYISGLLAHSCTFELK